MLAFSSIKSSLFFTLLWAERFLTTSARESQRELQVWVFQLDVENFQVLHFERFTCKVIKQLLESCGRLGEGGTGKHVFSVVRLLSARSTVGPFLQSGPEEALSVRHDVLDQVEEGALLRWTQAPRPDHPPAGA